MMEEKAQVNLEYLLVILGAVIVVTVVSLYIKSTAETVTDAGIEQAKNP
jgi:uncharacterized protein (UPF0333 family)